MAALALAVCQVFLGFTLTHAIYRLTYAAIFVALRKPWLWIATMAFLGAATVALIHELRLSPSVAFWTVLVLLGGGLAVLPTVEAEGPKKSELIAEYYANLGISYGLAKLKGGLWALGVSSAIAYLLFYATTA